MLPQIFNRFVRLKLSARGMRTVDKLGIDTILKMLRDKGEKV
jgi:large subunit ribosomal protein L28